MGIICKRLALAVVCHPLKIHYNFIPLPCTIFLPIIPQTGLLNESTTAEFSIPIKMRIQTNDWRWKTWLNNGWEEGERKASFFPHKSNYHLIDIRTIWISCRLEGGAALFFCKMKCSSGQNRSSWRKYIQGSRGRERENFTICQHSCPQFQSHAKGVEMVSVKCGNICST